MIDIVIYGTTTFSQELHYYIEADQQGKVVAFVLDRQYITDNEFDGLPVIPYDELESHYRKEDIEILIALGYSKMNDNRKVVFEKCRKDGWKIGSFIHSEAKNLASQIGIGNIIMEGADIRLHTKIGDGNIIISHTVIAHDSCVGNFNYFAGGCRTGGKVNIGDNNFFGINSTIEQECVIKDYNLIGAGACVSQNIESEVLVAPAPTKLQHINKHMMEIVLMKKLQ